MIDFNSSSLLSDRINLRIDRALELENSFQPKRDYLGASRVGVECERALQYEFMRVPKDHGRDFPGRILRVFERGHWVESAMIRWMGLAGFGLLDSDRAGKQFGFVSHGGHVAGHCDGIIIAGPDEFGSYPRLWECKGIQDKDWKALEREKLRNRYPVYYAQMQFYMEKFGLTENPALFSAVDANDMEIYWEEIPFVPDYYRMLDLKAEKIIQACREGILLSGIGARPDFYKCKWCSWSERCFNA